ncbi:hypothetical protein PF008_g29710 [Phytophthora fragariae]|uniref:Uncharacterized protein n=1 Tax=Phytophthora fragariae TaxID=53985 RepID=A0A6G0Q7L9_9STRA|nr:hypothetical protein PF008_g29710 [Phytophthora fragariae]
MRSLRSKIESQFFRLLTAYRKLVTNEELSKPRLKARLSHLYAVEEHATLLQPATVDFTHVIRLTKILRCNPSLGCL